MGIGLEQRCRGSRQTGGQDHRARDVPAASQDDIRAPAPEDLQRGGGRLGSCRERADECDAGAPRQAGAPKGVELVAGFRNEPSLDPIRRPGEAHVDAAFPQRFGDGERRQNVPGRSAGRDQAPELLLLRHGRQRC